MPVEALRAAETDDFEQTLRAIGDILVSNLLTPAGLRLLRLTNAVSGQMPEIGAFSVREGTEPTLNYLTDLFLRHLGPAGLSAREARLSASAFLNLVVGGPANGAAWGVETPPEEVAAYTRFSIGLMLNGLRSLGRPAPGG